VPKKERPNTHRQEVFAFAQSIEISPAEGERAKVCVDRLQERFGGRESERGVWRVGQFGIVRTLSLLFAGYSSSV